MVLSGIDWFVIIAFFALTLAIGLWVAKRAGSSSSEFFLSGRNMPWWLLGVSMVATTFSADTPNLVTDIVRQNGVAGNWVWWAFLLTGMLTVFVYAKLWRRSGALTDLEFYEMRYSGKEAAFLRGFRAVYLGFFFNVMIMATVCLAMIKIASVMLGWSAMQTMLIGSVVTVIYSALGGLRGVIITDFFQFIIAMIGAIGAAYVALNLPQVGGLDSLLAHPNLSGKLNLLPDFSNNEAVFTLLILPLAIQWWSVWYPGAEPGGGGYVAQRMLAAKSESHSMAATLFFNGAHYALRPWPWILVALASLVVFPDLESLRAAFPQIDPAIVKHDLAYPAMLTFLPAGLLGIVIASLIAAFMSTISTHLNWGASYLVHDFWARFINPDVGEKQRVQIGRLFTVLLMMAAAVVALLLSNALGAFNILLQIGAGTGLLFILRWFWWRINAYSELTAMVVSFAVALYFAFVSPDVASHIQLISGVAITTIAWVAVTFLTRPTDSETLRSFYKLVKPGGPGWRSVLDDAANDGVKLDDGQQAWDVPIGLLAMLFGCLAVYSALFATGYFLYGQTGSAVFLAALAIGAAATVKNLWGRMQVTS